jgi:hypothetical protein
MAKSRKTRKHSRQRSPNHFTRSKYARSLSCELLEERRLLAVVTVDTNQDVIDFGDD